MIQIINAAAFCIVILCWLGFAAAFLFRKKPPQSSEQKRNPRASLGIVLEGAGYALVWSFRRDQFSSIAPGGFLIDLLASMMASSLAILSVWLVLSAVRALGKQWAIAARIVEDHQLVTEGPYRLVRNPIYGGMFGMLIATGLVVSLWWALLLAVAVFWYGTSIRVRAEEKLLRESFGAKFEEYVRRVPVLLPRLF